MHKGSPAAVAERARSARRSAPLGSERTTIAAPSAASSTIRPAGELLNFQKDDAGEGRGRVRCFHRRSMKGFAILPLTYSLRLQSASPAAWRRAKLIRDRKKADDRAESRQPRGGFRGHQEERQAGEHSVAGARHHRLRRPRARAQERVPFRPERRSDVHDPGRDGPALPHPRRRGEGGGGPRGRDHLLPGRRAALAALLAGFVPPRSGAQAPARGEGSFLLVLRKVPRRALPGRAARRRLPRGPGVAGVRGVLFERVAPHLRQVRARDAEAGVLACRAPSAVDRRASPEPARLRREPFWPRGRVTTFMPPVLRFRRSRTAASKFEDLLRPQVEYLYRLAWRFTGSVADA